MLIYKIIHYIHLCRTLIVTECAKYKYNRKLGRCNNNKLHVFSLQITGHYVYLPVMYIHMYALINLYQCIMINIMLHISWVRRVLLLLCHVYISKIHFSD